MNVLNKNTKQKIALVVFRILGLLVVGILFWTLGFIIYDGIGVISLEFLTTAPSDGMTAGGIFLAIIGTLCLIARSVLFAFP